MDKDRLDTIVSGMFEHVAGTMKIKGIEYAPKCDDALSNFKRSGKILGCVPEYALMTFAMKHITSILDMVDDIDENRGIINLDVWREKIGDIIIYMLLLYAHIVERSDKQNRPHENRKEV